MTTGRINQISIGAVTEKREKKVSFFQGFPISDALLMIVCCNVYFIVFEIDESNNYDSQGGVPGHIYVNIRRRLQIPHTPVQITVDLFFRLKLLEMRHL